MLVFVDKLLLHTLKSHDARVYFWLIRYIFVTFFRFIYKNNVVKNRKQMDIDFAHILSNDRLHHTKQWVMD